MVDCDFFTDFNKDLTIESGRILLEFKECNYNLQLYSGPHPAPFPTLAADALRKVRATLTSAR